MSRICYTGGVGCVLLPPVDGGSVSTLLTLLAAHRQKKRERAIAKELAQRAAA
jgi:hypothetical protein